MARPKAVIPAALRELLSNSVDYAGLFPPASLDLATATTNYARYLEGPDRWMLGRFVIAATKIRQLIAEKSRLAQAGERGAANVWPVAVLLGADPNTDLAILENLGHGELAHILIDAVEAKVDDPERIDALAHAMRPEWLPLVVEVPIDRDPAPLINCISKSGHMAKARTGGVTPDAFPTTSDVVRFLRRCVEARVPFKLTAGLHHPVAGDYALTYAADAPRGRMFGYLTVFLAAAFMLGGMSDDDASRLLEERDSQAISVDDRGARWRQHRLGLGDLSQAHALMTVFGSCSFVEPVAELDDFIA